MGGGKDGNSPFQGEVEGFEWNEVIVTASLRKQ